MVSFYLVGLYSPKLLYPRRCILGSTALIIIFISIMVFGSGKKKTTIGRQHKQRNTFPAYKAAVAMVGLAGFDDPDPADPDPVVPPPGKRQRSHNNWRVARAVVACAKTVEQMLSKNDALAKSNASLTNTVHQQKSKGKEIGTREVR